MTGSESATKPADNSVFQHNRPHATAKVHVADTFLILRGFDRLERISLPIERMAPTNDAQP
jgi:hypothetical protein